MLRLMLSRIAGVDDAFCVAMSDAGLLGAYLTDAEM